jgi:DNA-binding GntR family transcriptional regulator
MKPVPQSTRILSFAPVPSQTRRAHIAAALRKALLSGELAPGSQLIEARLAEQFGVSRGPLREAIRGLINEGLLVNRPYAGTYVAGADVDSIEQMYSVRDALERHAFTLLWPIRDKRFREEIQMRHRLLLDAVDRADTLAQIEAEMNFHRCAYEFTGNAILLEMWDQLSTRLRLVFTIHRHAFKQGATYRAAHDRYLRLAMGKDLDAMLGEVSQHLSIGLTNVRRYLAERK